LVWHEKQFLNLLSLALVNHWHHLPRR
jgi:hypothetical protein